MIGRARDGWLQGGVKLKIDTCSPTDRAYQEHWPDLVAFFSGDQAGGGDGCLAVQNPGWRVLVVPVVVHIGDLGSMAQLREELYGTNLLMRHQVNHLATELQNESLCWMIHIIQRVMFLREYASPRG